MTQQAFLLEEQDNLKRVVECLKSKEQELLEKADAQDKSLNEIHDYFWNNYTEFDEYGYEMYDNANALYHEVQEKASYIQKAHIYKKMQDSPYFGRVDFCYEGEDIAEKCYIGIANFSDKTSNISRIFDWRAPISSLFYDYEGGECGYEAPMGFIKGIMEHKYQYKVKNSKLVYAIESGMNIDDDILKRELAINGTVNLKNIVSTIQREQNQIIRDKDHKILAVQGCAGSGKSSVALHRIAYLLYHNRKNLKASQVLILSPNSIFADYISRILPELGEANICEMSLDVYAYRKLIEIGEAQDLYDYLEEKLNPVKNHLYTKEAAYKQSNEYVKELDGFLLSLEYDLVDLQEFTYKGYKLDLNMLSYYFYEKLWNVPILDRLNHVAEFVIDEIETMKNQDLDEDSRIELLEKINRMYRTSNLFIIYNMFLKQSGRKKLEIKNNIIPYEDVYPLLYLKTALWGQQEKQVIKHLIIDEMQDYSYIQFAIIQKLFDCPMTFLGDYAQTLHEQKNDVLTFLPKLFGKELYTVTLEKSYRSTEEITKYAASILGMQTTNCIDRHGEIPEELHFETQEALIENLASRLLADMEHMDTVGVLCKTQEMANDYYELLLTKSRLPKENIHLLNKDSNQFNEGISIAPYYLVKGLEFDSVYIPEKNLYDSDMGRQALYIGCTRTLHRLTLMEC